jgi:hypothetical protein
MNTHIGDINTNRRPDFLLIYGWLILSFYGIKGWHNTFGNNLVRSLKSRRRIVIRNISYINLNEGIGNFTNTTEIMDVEYILIFKLF